MKRGSVLLLIRAKNENRKEMPHTTMRQPVSRAKIKKS